MSRSSPSQSSASSPSPKSSTSARANRKPAVQKTVKMITVKESEVEPTDVDLEAALADPAASEVSEEFVGKWNMLISTTNWEKGRIIWEWREALVSNEAPSTCYSDEAWARRVGGVSAQHVGRLRRVYDRFGGTYTSYNRIYWSHFLASLEWDDAEMWLEGASQSLWSVNDMRGARAKALGIPVETVAQEVAAEEQIVREQVDEDFEPLEEIVNRESIIGDAEEEDRVGTTGPLNEGADFGESDEGLDRRSDSEDQDDDDLPFDVAPPKSYANPFASLPQVPADVAEAMELFKLAIVRHRNSHWEEVSQAHLLQVLDAIRTFAAQEIS